MCMFHYHFIIDLSSNQIAHLKQICHVCVHKTSLTPPLLIEVPVPKKENCPFSTIVIFDFGIVQTVWHYVFVFHAQSCFFVCHWIVVISLHNHDSFYHLIFLQVVIIHKRVEARWHMINLHHNIMIDRQRLALICLACERILILW